MRLFTLRHPIVAWRRTRVLPRWVRRADRRANRWLNRRAERRVTDSGLRRLSRAADGSRLWFVAAVVITLVGRPRAAARGVVSLAVASALANLVVKRVFGGPRPVHGDTPAGRRIKRFPTSGAFPSGHSASAAGFAAGVALESPRIGAVVAPVAGAVAYSRVHVGAHWVSDVVGGTALGVATALATAAIVRPHRPAAPPPATPREHIQLPALPDGDGLLIVRNEASGTSVHRADPAPVFARELPRARVVELGPDDDVRDVLHAEVARNRPAAIGVYGGDGTVSTVAGIARDLQLPLAPMPGGTFNHFVGALGIESLDDAIASVRAGDGMPAGLATVTENDGDEVAVVNTVAIGIYSAFVAERLAHQERWGKWVAAVYAAVRAVRHARPVDVTVDGEPMSLWAMFVSVGESPAGRAASLGRRDVDGRILDVRLLHDRGSTWQVFAALAFGRPTLAALRRLGLVDATPVEERRRVTELDLEIPGGQGAAADYAHDGELADIADAGYRLRLQVHPDSLRVYVPRQPRPQG